MSSLILSSKFSLPPARPAEVRRETLLAQLDRGMPGGLTLVSVAAGFGKSSLLASWAREQNAAVAWLSLDAAEQDSHRFLRYIVTALQQVCPNWGGTLAALLEQSVSPAMDALLTVLINALPSLPDSTVLILDDYHLAASPGNDATLRFLLDHLPATLRLVMATREDPDLPLARLRAGGRLCELRASDLRFRTQESAQFLQDTMGLTLNPTQLAALERRTEGWVAALQMAALSLRNQEDPDRFIAAFAGSHRFVVDFLMEEVLQTQSPEVQEFLRCTCLLDRLSVALCDAVTGQRNSGSMLAQLERSNLFLLPLDSERQWYRYHHLFADVLRIRLAPDEDLRSSLHTRASAWYESQHEFVEAIEHAMAGKDFALAASLIERYWPGLRAREPEIRFYGWMAQLPPEAIAASPILSSYRVFALLSSDLDAAEQALRQAEAVVAQAQGSAGTPGELAVNEAELAHLPGILAIANAYLAGARGDADDIVRFSQQALAKLTEEQLVWRSAAKALLGMAHWRRGDLNAAFEVMADGVEPMLRAGDPGAAISVLFLLADIRIAQCRLDEASALCDRALGIASPLAWYPQGSADILVLQAELHWEQGDFTSALQVLEQSRAMPDTAALPENRHRWPLIRARIAQSQGEQALAREYLQEAEEVQEASPAPNARPVRLWRVRERLRAGRLQDAVVLFGREPLDWEGVPDSLEAFRYLTAVRVLLQRFESRAAPSLLNDPESLLRRMLAQSDGDEQGLCVLEARLLLALVCERQGDALSAEACLRDALIYAEQAGIWQSLVDDLPALVPVLTRLQSREPELPLLQDLLVMAGVSPEQPDTAASGQEALSDRELDVLRALAGEQSGPEIAASLYISLNTLRTHTKRIYQKLGESSRLSAVRRARELKLIP